MPSRARRDPRLERAALELAADVSAIRLGAAAHAPFPGGHSALALAHAVLDEALPDRGHASRVDRHLALAARALGRHPVGPTFYGGFTGVAWVTEHLGRSGDDEESPIDDALEALLSRRRKRWPDSYDFTSGLVGYGVYALERMPRPAAARIVERVVLHLDALATRVRARAGSVRSGVAWRSQSAWIPANLRSAVSRSFNLGLAHGVPGVIAFLAGVHGTGIERRRVARMLDGAVAWLLAQELPKSSPSAFALSTGTSPAPARTAWCYGDPGVAAALVSASRASGERAWLRAAVRIGLRAVARDPSTNGAADAGLCHGRAGLAHLFHRLYVGTGDDRFRVAAYDWLARTLDLRDAAGGVAGYRSLHDRRGKDTWKRDATFLNGTPGVAMAVASFLTDPDAPTWGSWDRALLLTVKEQRGT